MKKMNWIGISFGVIILIASFFISNDNLTFFLIGLAFLVIALPFIAGMIFDTNISKEKNERFLEFSRNLAESVKSGTPIGKSIINMRDKNFGSLTPHVQKLANQIMLGIPINKALQTFALDVDSETISRAVYLIREAESAGGQIDNILDSVASSIYQIEKLKKERKAAIYNLVVQGYIIFFIFIGIMLVMQYQILPLTSDISGVSSLSSTSVGQPASVSSAAPSPEDLAKPFLYLLVIQGIFVGLTVGKLAEGSVRAGIKHSFILAVAAFLIFSGTRVILG